MSSGGAAASGAAAAAAAVAEAVKASGAIVRVEPRDFLTLVARADQPLIVTGSGGIIRKVNQYLMGYRGLVFYTQSTDPLTFDAPVDIINAQRIWIPG